MKFFKFIFKNLFGLILACLLVWIVTTKIVANGQIKGDSMEPNFHNNDRVLAMRRTNPNRGDVIILQSPADRSTYYIERVISVPGDLITVKNDVLYVNNKPQEEKYLDEAKAQFRQTSQQDFTTSFDLFRLTGRSQVPINSYFVMGDNRPNSKDSRSFGFVNETLIQSVVWLRYYPFNSAKIY